MPKNISSREWELTPDIYSFSFTEVLSRNSKFVPSSLFSSRQLISGKRNLCPLSSVHESLALEDLGIKKVSVRN